jgi:hypothetical protein
MNDQYVPPIMRQEQADFVSARPEYVPEPAEWYDRVTLIETRLEMARADANEETIPRHTVRQALRNAVRNLVSLPSKKEKLIDRLIEVEATIGGEMLPKSDTVISQRFWFDKQRDWHYEVVEANGSSYARYQVRDGQLIKSVGATTLPLAEGEQEFFTVWTQRYYDTLAAGLYQDSVVAHEMRGLDEELDYLLTTPDVKKVLSNDKYDLTV